MFQLEDVKYNGCSKKEKTYFLKTGKTKVQTEMLEDLPGAFEITRENYFDV